MPMPAMSKNKIGALLVFERNSILDTSLNSGTVLDAAVSSELLKNIFWPKAPMHDGAVLVRNGVSPARAACCPSPATPISAGSWGCGTAPVSA